jgi:CDP-diacylglycerol--glycerol-3-phosphate 3-phosphatidyltransferase
LETQKVVPQKQKVTTKLNRFRKHIASYLTPAIVRLLARTSITPNALTVAGFIVTLAAAGLILARNPLAAGIVVIVAGFFDLIDGSTKFGGILDSTLDRLSEAALLLSLLVVFAANGSVVGVWITGIGLISSQLVSYIRSRAEAAGIDCEVGIFTRPERVVVLAIGLLLGRFQNALLISLGIIAFFSVVTVFQRIFYAWKLTRK